METQVVSDFFDLQDIFSNGSWPSWIDDFNAAAIHHHIAKGDVHAQAVLELLTSRFEDTDCSTKSYQSGNLFGYPGSNLPVFIIAANLYALQYNANNIMLHFGNKTKSAQLERDTFNVFQEMEVEYLAWLGRLFNTNEESSFGYITPGGTESNLYAYLSARKFFKSKFPKQKVQIVMAGPGHTHYSFWKLENLFNMTHDYHEIHYSSSGKFTFDAEKLKNIPTFVVLNAPSINTGLIDDPSILASVEQSVDQNKIWCHVDAAFGGLVLPFLNSEVFDHRLTFDNELVKSITIDPHKTGFAPYGTGAILIGCKEAQGLIATDAAYISDGQDITLCGSRSSANVCCAWSAMEIMKESGFRDIWTIQMTLVNRFVDYFNESPFFEVIGHPDTPVFAVRVTEEGILNEWLKLVEEYTIVETTLTLNHRNETIYRFCIMPHVKEKNVEQFIAKLERAIGHKQTLETV